MRRYSSILGALPLTTPLVHEGLVTMGCISAVLRRVAFALLAATAIIVAPPARALDVRQLAG